MAIMRRIGSGPGLILVLSTMAMTLGNSLEAGERAEPTRSIVYKTVGDVALRLHVFEPAGHQASDRRPAIVFFFGGGWKGGSPNQFYPHAAHLASRGMVAISAEYRVHSRHGTSPYECVKDGKSALRYVRRHASESGIDPDRIAAGGGSAGGHVAAATATIDAFNEADADPQISPIPNALVLFNPVYDNGPNGYGHDRVKEHWQEFSPLHNIDGDVPPTIVFLGTQDKLIPVATAKEFQKRMKAFGVTSELHLYEGQPHGFFNYRTGKGTASTENTNPYYGQTVAEMDRFLESLGWLESAR